MADFEKHYATFGGGHEYSGCYVEIISESHHTAILFMMKAHGSRWSGDAYTAERFAGQIERYGMQKLATVRQREATIGDVPFFDVVRDSA